MASAKLNLRDAAVARSPQCASGNMAAVSRTPPRAPVLRPLPAVKNDVRRRQAQRGSCRAAAAHQNRPVVSRCGRCVDARNPRELDEGQHQTSCSITPAQFEAARRAIDRCVDAVPLLQMRERTILISTLAGIIRDRTLERRAVELRLKCERRLGEISAGISKSPGTRGPNARRTKAETLRAAGVGHSEANRFGRDCYQAIRSGIRSCACQACDAKHDRFA